MSAASCCVSPCVTVHWLLLVPLLLLSVPQLGLELPGSSVLLTCQRLSVSCPAPCTVVQLSLELPGSGVMRLAASPKEYSCASEGEENAAL